MILMRINEVVSAAFLSWYKGEIKHVGNNNWLQILVTHRLNLERADMTWDSVYERYIGVVHVAVCVE